MKKFYILKIHSEIKYNLKKASVDYRETIYTDESNKPIIFPSKKECKKYAQMLEERAPQLYNLGSIDNHIQEAEAKDVKIGKLLHDVKIFYVAMMPAKFSSKRQPIHDPTGQIILYINKQDAKNHADAIFAKFPELYNVTLPLIIKAVTKQKMDDKRKQEK